MFSRRKIFVVGVVVLALVATAMSVCPPTYLTNATTRKELPGVCISCPNFECTQDSIISQFKAMSNSVSEKILENLESGKAWFCFNSYKPHKSLLALSCSTVFFSGKGDVVPEFVYVLSESCALHVQDIKPDSMGDYIGPMPLFDISRFCHD